MVAPMDTSAMVQVSFNGDVLEAVADGDKVWVSLRRGCENLGLDFSKQFRKLKRKAWAVVAQRAMTGPDGKRYTAVVVDLDTLPGWLFSIDGNRVAEHLREKLVTYQKSAARVLADHFLRKPRQPEPDMVAVLLRRIQALERVVTAPPQHAVAIGAAPCVPRFTVAERLRFKGWFTTSPKHRHTIRRLANALLDSRHQETPDLIGGTCFYHSHQLLCLDEAIDRVRDDAVQRERAAGPTLYTNLQ